MVHIVVKHWAILSISRPLPVSQAEYRAASRRIFRAIRSELSDERYAVPKTQVIFLSSEHRIIIDAHGDLRPQHICLTAPPVIIDCLEFNREFRILDPMDELAYFVMECERLGAAHIGEEIMGYYSKAANDACPIELIGFYKVFRACLRAKIAVWHIADHQVQDHQRWHRLAQTYLNLAEQYLRHW